MVAACWLLPPGPEEGERSQHAASEPPRPGSLSDLRTRRPAVGPQMSSAGRRRRAPLAQHQHLP